ncbi:hypothetical protein [Streptomyces sp. NPDC058145]|uniref:hypothetical protein n=1 Tax=Streptomyces sp. NPDC058145 TaxID=3346356 RepID=UPI0036EE936C
MLPSDTAGHDGEVRRRRERERTPRIRARTVSAPLPGLSHGSERAGARTARAAVAAAENGRKTSESGSRRRRALRG